MKRINGRMRFADGPAPLDSPDVTAALEEVASLTETGRRIDLISSRFLGKPYVDNPLGGGPGQDEVLTSSSAGFDCVTYVETVLALENASTAKSFLENLRRLRYKEGRVEWRSRNHYMTDWARNNRKAGFVEILTEKGEAEKRLRRLNIVQGLREKGIIVRCQPKQKILRSDALGQTGDIVMFVSTKKNLDVFHLGFVVRSEGARLLRHASRTERKVVEEDLESFVKRHRMSGIILLRPLCRR